MERSLLLSGFMGTGKSTVGRRLAERAGVELVDLDLEIERVEGRRVREIFEAVGEEGFRAIERRELGRVLDGPPGKVVALGGGALLDRTLRLRALDEAIVVVLEASPGEILRRTSTSRDRPLLDGGDPAERIERFLAARRLVYCECHARVTTEGKSPADVAEEVARIWSRAPVAVAAGDATYAVEVGTGLLDDLLPPLIAGASRAVVVTDQHVEALHGEALSQALALVRVPAARVVLTPGEEHKTPRALEQIWSAALGSGADRKSRFVALGGGVVTDVAGFAAATYMRGVSWVGAPTTLLAMVDASVGGKTAVDLPGAKNAVGAFWQPRGVLCDVDLLRTEPPRGFASALAEVVKTAIIGDPELLDRVDADREAIARCDSATLSDVVRRSVRVKARVVGLDPREDGIRAWLNLGHTVGHALEAQGGYGRLRHGEAVSLGLVAALRIGQRLGVTPRGLVERVTGSLAALGLPVDVGREPLREAVELLGHDKKRAGSRVKFVVARELGRVELVELPLDELSALVLGLAG